MLQNDIYAATARFDTGRAMTEDELRHVAPSIFATEAHHSRSERFAPIPTIEILRGLAKEGFHPVGAKQAVARIDDRKDFTKHLIRLRRLDDDKAYRVNDTVCEILLKNGNDGSSAYELLAGLFRIACLNSLVAMLAAIDSLKVRHSGDAMGKVIEGSFTVLESAKLALAAPQDWSQIALDRDERQVFANAVHQRRFADAEGNVTTLIKPEQLLVQRREADLGNDLWTTYNVVQENTMRGGIEGIGRDADNRVIRRTSRPVKGIDQDVKLNRAMFTLADQMAKLKKAA